MRTYMVSTLLRDTDSVSMARSLEVRVPLLDTPVVEFIGSLPEAARRRPGAQKALLAEALGDLLPREILGQRKRTFTCRGRSGYAGRCVREWKRVSPTLRRCWRLIFARGALARSGRIFLPGKPVWSRHGPCMC